MSKKQMFKKQISRKQISRKRMSRKRVQVTPSGMLKTYIGNTGRPIYYYPMSEERAAQIRRHARESEVDRVLRTKEEIHEYMQSILRDIEEEEEKEIDKLSPR